MYCRIEPASDQFAQARVDEHRRSLRRQLLEAEESAVFGRSSLSNVMVCHERWLLTGAVQSWHHSRKLRTRR
jgi:hypothetical protein